MLPGSTVSVVLSGELTDIPLWQKEMCRGTWSSILSLQLFDIRHTILSLTICSYTYIYHPSSPQVCIRGHHPSSTLWCTSHQSQGSPPRHTPCVKSSVLVGAREHTLHFYSSPSVPILSSRRCYCSVEQPPSRHWPVWSMSWLVFSSLGAVSLIISHVPCCSVLIILCVVLYLLRCFSSPVRHEWVVLHCKYWLELIHMFIFIF